MESSFKKQRVGKKRSKSKRRRSTTTKASARKYDKMNAATMGFMGIEKKFLDTAIETTAITANDALTGGEYDPPGGASGCLNTLSAPSRGDGPQQRNGQRIRLKSLVFKGKVFRPPATAAAAGGNTEVFVALVLDKQSNGAQLSSEDVFTNPVGIIGVDNAGNACPLRNLLTSSRYRVLKSQVYRFNNHAITYNGVNLDVAGESYTMDWYIPLEINVEFNNNTAADVANVVDNSIHVIAFASATGCSIAYNSRVRFVG